MEDENGLDLSLGLSYTGSSVKSKIKDGSSSDTQTEGERGGKIVDDFNSFFHAGTQKQDSTNGTWKSDSLKPQENFFNDLSVAKDVSTNLNGGVSVGNNSKAVEIVEDKRVQAGSKRKMFFDEINHQKKQERESHHANLHDRTRTTDISITENGSIAENEDVAESDIENASSRLISHHDEASKCFVGVSGSSEIPKEVHIFRDSNVADLNGQKKFNDSLENELKLANLTYGAPFSAQPVNMMNITNSIPGKESNSIGNSAPSSQGLPIPGTMQVTPNATTGAQPVSAGNLPQMFGYSPVQIPMLDKDASLGLGSHPHPHPPQFQPSYAGRGPRSSVAMQVIQNDSSDAAQYDVRPLERTKGDGKQHSTEEGSFSQAEDVKGSSTNLRAKALSERSVTEGFSLNFSAIKPGIAADVKFGGYGSYPNLPWVSTTGSGPNGRTISGVTYRYNTNQIRIVCACHGSHMSPEEFVRHASEVHANPDDATGLGPVSSSKPAASAHT